MSHHTINKYVSTEIDLHSLQVSTLRRYKKHFKISTKPGLNKNQLAEVSFQYKKKGYISPKKEVSLAALINLSTRFETKNSKNLT